MCFVEEPWKISTDPLLSNILHLLVCLWLHCYTYCFSDSIVLYKMKIKHFIKLRVGWIGEPPVVNSNAPVFFSNIAGSTSLMDEMAPKTLN